MSDAELAYEPNDSAGTVTSYDLGYAGQKTRPDEDVYWAEVSRFLAQLPRNFSARGLMAITNLLGDGVLPGDPGSVARDDDPEFAAAREARGLARRWIAKASRGV
ncbi:MAG: hypothetical protein Q9188_006110 [Gyalolechia gomerana]